MLFGVEGAGYGDLGREDWCEGEKGPQAAYSVSHLL